MIQKPRGTRDFLPEEMAQRRELEQKMRKTAASFGFGEIVTPMFEEQELFVLKSGEGILGEMYAFEDKGDRKIALRPELTAPTIRAYVNEAQMAPKPIRWFYFEECFRYERPQKGRYREFFVIFHAPADAPPGEYVGRLKVVEDGKDAGSLGLRLAVYPFELPRARTHYDTSREYRLMMFASLTLPTFISHGKDLVQAERRLRNVITECVKHNFLYPCSGQCKVESLDTDDLAVRTLLIWRECGLPCDPIILGGACDTAWVNRKINGERATPENDPEALRETIRTKTVPYVDRHLAAAEKFLGHRNWMLSGRDEAPPKVQRLQTGFFRAVKDRGAGIFATTMGPMYRQVSWLDDLADVAARCSYSFAGGWHAGGARALTYAAPFTGMECPDVWRRTKGIRFYFADFDGLDDYHLFREDFGNIWNGLTPLFTGFRHFHAVFPTEDGVITTIAFEGMREALDDVRYFSLLKLLARQGIRSGDPAKRAAGRAEIAWIDATDPELVYDLDAFRAELAERNRTRA